MTYIKQVMMRSYERYSKCFYIYKRPVLKPLQTCRMVGSRSSYVFSGYSIKLLTKWRGDCIIGSARNRFRELADRRLNNYQTVELKIVPCLPNNAVTPPHCEVLDAMVVAFVLAVHYNLGTCEGACARERERERELKMGRERQQERERVCDSACADVCVCVRACVRMRTPNCWLSSHLKNLCNLEGTPGNEKLINSKFKTQFKIFKINSSEIWSFTFRQTMHPV